MRKPDNLVLINLAVTELILAAVGIPLDINALMKEGWVLGKFACVFSGGLVTTAGKNYKS